MFSVVDATPGPGFLGRREFLRIGGLALGGLTLPDFSFAASGDGGKSVLRDRSVVLLFLQGGPPQIETFDPKPDAPSPIRSVTGHVPTSLPGLHFGGSLPKMAHWADKMAIVHSFETATGVISHEAGYDALMMGGGNAFKAGLSSLYGRVAGTLHPRTAFPSQGFILPEAIDPDLELGRPTNSFTLQDNRRYLASAGELGAQYAPFDPVGGGQLLGDLELAIPRERFADRRRLIGELDRLRRHLDASPSFATQDAIRQQAAQVLLHGISNAFDLAKEDSRTIERYDTRHLVPLRDIRPGGKWHQRNFNRTTNLLGHQMLLARRLCEAGCGFVTVVDSCWDFHDDSNNPPVDRGMQVLSPQLDHAVSAFLEDVEQRGLSDRILLVITAEFGRKPWKGEGTSRLGSTHWASLAPLIFAGGGLKMGQVIGTSDRDGAYPATQPYTPRHLMATLMHTLLDLGEVRLRSDLPQELVELVTTAEPIRELF